MKHIITAIVENQPGVLTRIVGVISGRGYNIETLNVGPTHNPEVSKMTMVVPGDDHVLEQVTRQLEKQIDVLEVHDVTRERQINRELILVEISTANRSRSEIIELASLFDGRIVGVREASLTVELAGSEDSIRDFLRLIRPLEIIDISRSGVIAVARGA